MRRRHLLQLSLFAAFISFPVICMGQDNSAASIFNWLDQTTGVETTALFNGPAYPYKYRLDGTTIQFLDWEFKKGSVVYDGQTFYDASLKLDIHNDALLLEKSQQITPIHLIKQKVSSFTIEDKKFVNLSYENKPLPDFVSGYYEVIDGKHVALYIKHFKNVRQVLKDDRVHDVFFESPSFVVLHKSQYHLIKSKRDLVKLFKQEKQAIDDYYQMNSKMEKLDKTKFMTGLIMRVDNTISP